MLFEQLKKLVNEPPGISEAELVGAIVNLLRTFHEIEPDDHVLANALKNVKNDYEVFNLRLEHHVGICCDRSMLFMMFANRLGLTANYLFNDAHAFIEYHTDDRWHQVCLGGGKCDVQIKKLPYLKKFKLKEAHLEVKSSAMVDSFKLSSLNLDNYKNVSAIFAKAKMSIRIGHDNMHPFNLVQHIQPKKIVRKVWFDKEVFSQYPDEDHEMCLSFLRSSLFLWALIEKTESLLGGGDVIELEKPEEVIDKITTILSDRKNALLAQADESEKTWSAKM